MSYSDATSETITARGEEIYHPLRDKLESQYKGQFFVVDLVPKSKLSSYINKYILSSNRLANKGSGKVRNLAQ